MRGDTFLDMQEYFVLRLRSLKQSLAVPVVATEGRQRAGQEHSPARFDERASQWPDQTGRTEGV